MKIEAGKYYKTRDGRKVGPMRRRDGHHEWVWDIDAISRRPEIFARAGGMLWSKDGSCDEGREFDLISEWTEPTAENEPRGVAHFNPKDGDRFVCTWTGVRWWTVGKVYVWNDSFTSDNGCPGMLGGDATFLRADPEPVALPEPAAVSDRPVPLPAAVTFRDEEDGEVTLGHDSGNILFNSRIFTPATARALAHWLTVFADAADAGEARQ